MTNGQLAQLRDLSKCYMPLDDMAEFDWLRFHPRFYRLNKHEKTQMRRLTHLYRHQIAAIKRNQS
jgi:hypothetical protein